MRPGDEFDDVPLSEIVEVPISEIVEDPLPEITEDPPPEITEDPYLPFAPPSTPSHQIFQNARYFVWLRVKFWFQNLRNYVWHCMLRLRNGLNWQGLQNACNWVWNRIQLRFQNAWHSLQTCGDMITHPENCFLREPCPDLPGCGWLCVLAPWYDLRMCSELRL